MRFAPLFPLLLVVISLSSRLSNAADPHSSDHGWQKQGLMFKMEPGVLVQNFTSPAEPLQDGRWRIWCSLSGAQRNKNLAFAEGRPGGDWKVTEAVLSPGAPDLSAPFAIGGVPEGWHLVQGVHVKLPQGGERLYFWAHGEGVVRYVAADRMSDAGDHYRIVNAGAPCLYHPADRAVGGPAALEAELLRWAKKVAAPLEGEALASGKLISNDATNVYVLPDGTFEMYTVGLVQIPKEDPRFQPQDNIPGLLRVIDRLTSKDGLKWGNRQRVIEPDEKDPVDQQFYFLSVTHTDAGRVGVLGHYRLGAQTIDLERCSSADGIRWERMAREPWISRGGEGSLDGYLLHAPHAMVRREGKWWLFYTGGNFSHNRKLSYGPEHRGIFLATRPDLAEP
ncbi:hypothetical protein [Verrucomicrobium sp. BvORR106]|uniref:hypothetical protein n=1 Tax=Verrucomicrobium sp. BvORR106 TaxID=1403819 RepID=UPI000A6D4F8C|nr:hypothetical protein [Verrucomicrobium sp. BvORR106]